MNDDIRVEVYEDGVKIIFNVTTLDPWRYVMLTDCIRRNQVINLIQVIDVYVDKHSMTSISINGIEKKSIPEFIELLKVETLTNIQHTFVMAKLVNTTT
jgi:hypothetical protein